METANNTDKAIVVHLGFGPELPGASHLLRLMLASFLQDRCHGSSGCLIFLRSFSSFPSFAVVWLWCARVCLCVFMCVDTQVSNSTACGEA